MKLTESVFELQDVHLIVEKLSEVLQRAIIIEDSNFELVAYSSPNEFSFDPIQQKTILTKRCPLFIIERLKKDGIVDRLKTEDNPIRLQSMEDVKFYQRIVVSIKHNGMLYGYLWIYEADDSFDEKVFSYLTKVAPHIGQLLYEHEMKHHSTKFKDASSFLWKLLNDDFLNNAAIHREAKLASFHLPTQFSIVVVSVKEANYIYVLSKMKQFFLENNVSFYLGKGTEIVGLIDYDMYQTMEEVVGKIKNALEDEERLNTYIGIGNKQNEIRDIRNSYLQALEVIETMFFLNIKEQQFYYFKELGVAKFAKYMYKKNIEEQYRHEEIVTLLQKDIENNSELMKTLWMYIRNDCKVGQTAERLFIHPNTLNYRLKQILSLTSIDFSNVHEKVDLYNELFLIHFVPEYFEHYKMGVH